MDWGMVPISQRPGRLGMVFVLFSFVIGISTWMTPVDFDEAFNFQVAQSLVENL